MVRPYTTAAKAVLGAALVVFCAVLLLYATKIGNLSEQFVSNAAQWSAIVILFVIVLVLPQARRRDEARNLSAGTSATKTADPSHGLKAIRIGAILLALSVILFIGAPSFGNALPNGFWDAVSFVDTALLFFGALYLVAGLRSRLRRPK